MIDSLGDTLTKTFTFAPLLATPAALPGDTVNTAYNQTITVSGGTTPYTTFTVTSFSAGTTGLTAAEITANAAAGTFVIAGTPAATGVATFSIDVVDSAGATLTENYTITVNSPLTITPSLPQGTANAVYHQVIAVAGGTTPFTTFAVSGFSGGTTGITAGEITANAAAGTFTISGTPTAGGTVTFTVNVVDTAGAALTENYTLTINPPLTITSALPYGTVDTTYNQVITVSGGTMPFTNFVYELFKGGTTGLNYGEIAFNATAGTFTINGTPTGTGTATFTISVTDSAGATLTKNFSIVITTAPGPLSITPTLVQGTADANYHQTLTVTGGTMPYTTFAVSGFAPAQPDSRPAKSPPMRRRARSPSTGLPPRPALPASR